MFFRKVLVGLLLVSLIFFQLGGLVIALGFKLNQDYITHNLCVNRFKPLSLCFGACYLKKE